jgi:hypothetical protein
MALKNSTIQDTVRTQLQGLGISTKAQVDTFCGPPFDHANMLTVMAAVRTAHGDHRVSRRQIKADARVLLAEGLL